MSLFSAKPVKTKNTSTSTTSNTGVSTTSTSLPDWLKQPSMNIAAQLGGAVNQGFVPYTGDMTAGMNDNQLGAIEQFKSLLSNGTALPRVIDNIPGTGAAGSTQDYMNQYTDAALAPTMRAIETSRKQSNMSNDAAANMAGAFGDTGHALEKAETNERAAVASGDATARAYEAAFNTAMGLKQGDINRMQAQQGQKANLLQQLFGMGTQQQATEQRGLDAKLAEFLRGQGWTTEQLGKITQILNALPRETSQTTSTNTSGTQDSTSIGKQSGGGPSTFGQIVGGIGTLASIFMGAPSAGGASGSGGASGPATIY